MAKKQKVLQNDSIFNELDVDGDGVITDEEMKQAEELMRLEQERERFKNEDAKEDQIRAMASHIPHHKFSRRRQSGTNYW